MKNSEPRAQLNSNHYSKDKESISHRSVGQKAPMSILLGFICGVQHYGCKMNERNTSG